MKIKKKYKVNIEWSEEDEAYLAKVPELALITHGDTKKHAREMAKEAIDLCLSYLRDEKKKRKKKDGS